MLEMYVKLAMNNVKKSIKDYLIYFITITICVSLFYAITSLSSSSYELITEESYNFKALNLILQYSTYIITAILIFLVAYVNKYIIKRRKREFATYVLLGAEQKKIALMFFIETLVIGVLAIIVGIFVGTIFSQIITAIVLISAKQEVVFSLRLYMDTVLSTFIFFIAIFCIIGFYNVIVLRKIKLIDMINAHKIVEFKFKRSGKIYGAIFIVAIILYIISGSCTLKLLNSEIDYSITMLMDIGISLVTFILATYGLFYSIAYVMIYIKNRWINFKYEGTNLFLIGSIVSKIKTAPRLMATISITFLGAMICFILTLVLAQWTLGYLNMRVPYDIEIRNDYGNKINDVSQLAKLDYSQVLHHLNDSGYEVEEYCEVEKFFVEDTVNNIKLSAITLSDFNKLRSMLGYESVELKENEFTTQWYSAVPDELISDYVDEINELSINGEKYEISENSSYKESIGEGFYANVNNIIILPDGAFYNIDYLEKNFVANIKDEMTYEDAYYFQSNYVDQWFENNNSDEYDVSEGVVSTRIKSLETNNILVTTLAMRILGIYLGVVLLMISLTILSLSQLSESIEHKDRFKILGKLGIEPEKVNKIILKQIAVYFIVPIFIALIGCTIFVYNFYIFYKDIITVFVGGKIFILSVSFGIFLMLIVYLSYFIGTYYTFKRNINS